MTGGPPIIRPEWPVPAGVHALCTTRAGGVSLPPYDSLNLGDHVNDDPVAVQANRRVLLRAAGVRPVFLQQVHGTQVVALTDRTPDATPADGCIATQPGVACTIMVADCLPVLFADAKGRAVAAAHAGWRGLAGEGGHGVLEETCSRLQGATGGGEVLAWLGPCIGPKAFEVGDEVRAAFVDGDTQAAPLFRPHAPGKWLADLQGLARLRLAALGITRIHGNDGSDAWCTVNNPSRFFSHRRDRVSGRFAACIWLG
ncbi:MAG: peptidoglycan editing factor PgeF [Proteobacteria bacterium]|nr:peptidoglycan editing factor PgeF [Pseudomonadota bacterium]